MLLLSKTTAFPYYIYKTPSFHETLMEQSTPREQLTILRCSKWKWAPDIPNSPIFLSPILEIMMYSWGQIGLANTTRISIGQLTLLLLIDALRHVLKKHSNLLRLS